MQIAGIIFSPFSGKGNCLNLYQFGKKTKSPFFFRIGSDQAKTFNENLNHPLNEDDLIYQKRDEKTIQKTRLK